MKSVKKLFSSKYFQILLLIALGYFLFISGNDNFTLYDNSETNYSAVAREIVNTGDWLSMHYNGENWYIHPPHYFWMASFIGESSGWTEYNLRLIEGLFGILGVIITFLLAGNFFSRKTAFISSVVLATSFYYYVISHLAIFDTMLNFFIILRTYFFLKAYYQQENKHKFMMLFGISSGLAVLTKGPIGLVHPLMVIIPFLLWKRDLLFLFTRKSVTPVLLFLLIAAPWYGHQLYLHGAEFFNVALKDYTWYRFLGVVENQNGPWYYYFPVLLLFYPWIFYLPGAIYVSVKQNIFAYNSKRNSFIIFSWLFIVITFLFFSVAQTKLPNYIFSLFPFLAILTGYYLKTYPDHKITRISSVIMFLFSLILTIIAVLIELPEPYSSDQSLLVTFFAIPMVISLIYSFYILKNKFTVAISTMAGGTVLFALFVVNIFLPNIEDYKYGKQFVKLINRNKENYEIINYKGYSPFLMYYLNHKVEHISSKKKLYSKIKNKEKKIVYIVIPNKNKDILSEYEHKTLEEHYEKTLIKID